MAVPVVKFLEHCEPPTLVKINVENVARFAFLAKRGNAMIPAYVLLEDRCEVFNLAGSVGFLPHYESVAALDFGNDFVVQPYTASLRD